MLELKVLIVDDEPLAREGLVQALADFKEVNILGECANGFEAVKSIKKLKPDLVFHLPRFSKKSIDIATFPTYNLLQIEGLLLK